MARRRKELADTAVAEPVTAPETEATEIEESPEAALIEDTETEGSEADTDSEEPTEEPATLTREEHEAALKAAIAKTEESHRQKLENAQKQAQETANAEAYRANVTRAQQAKAGAILQEFNEGIAFVMKKRDEGEDVTVSPQWLSQIAARQADAAFWDQESAIAEFFDAHVAKDGWRKPAELSQALDRALHLHVADPNRPAAVLEARLSIMEAAVREQITPKLREEIEAEVRAELSAGGKTAAMKANDAARANQPKPTGVGGAPSNERLTRAALSKMSTNQILELTRTPAGQKAVDKALSGG